MQNTEQSEYVSVRDAAEYLGVHPKTVIRYINEGRLEAHQNWMRRWQVSRESMIALANTQYKQQGEQ